MHIEDRTEMLANLKSGREVFLKAISEIPEDLARRTPAPGKWSALECAEHVAAVEEYLLAQVANATRSETPIINIRREEAILDRGMDRSRRVEAPDAAKPRNRFGTLQEALMHFQATRQETIGFVEDLLEDPRTMMAHHPLIGPANVYEILLIMAVHPHRHAQQIREIVEALRSLSLLS